MQRISVPSRRKGHTQSTMHPWGRVISTHTLRMEGDICGKSIWGIGPPFLPTPSARRATVSVPPAFPRIWEFLPTPSARRATLPPLHLALRRPISTHALREEGDQQIRRKPRPIYRQHDGSKSKIHKNPRKTRFFPGTVSSKIPLSPPKSGANPADSPCMLPVRTTQILTAAGHHPAATAGTSPHVPPYSDSGSPAGKTAGYRSRGQ